MSHTEKAFHNGKAFLAFLTCGDPDLATTEVLIKEIANAGADLIELGIPFSDPIAEGPVIQNANVRALAQGVTTDKIFDMVRRIRSEVLVPMVFMTYANVVYSYGTERFLKTCAQIGMDGLILPDVPFEEKEEFAPACKRYGLDFISLIAPTSRDRISMIAKEADGFIYCVSSMGVTGVRNKITTDLTDIVQSIRGCTDQPVAIGFGISSPDQAFDMAQKADGVIVGSAIVSLIEQHRKNAVPYVSEYVKSIKQAITKFDE